MKRGIWIPGYDSMINQKKSLSLTGYGITPIDELKAGKGRLEKCHRTKGLKIHRPDPGRPQDIAIPIDNIAEVIVFSAPG